MMQAPPLPPERYFAVWSALNKLLDEYGTLQPGVYRPGEIQRWLDDRVHPAIVEARRVMGRQP